MKCFTVSYSRLRSSMNRLYRLASLAIVVCLATGANAFATDFSVGPTISTLGLGLEGNYQVLPQIGVRGGFNMFSMGGITVKGSGVSYQGDINLRSFGATVDVYPLAGVPLLNGFRGSLGLRYNGNSFDVTATPASSVKIGNSTYTPAQIGTIKGTIDYMPVNPYFGIGYSTNLLGTLYLNLDAGALYQGTSNVKLSSTGMISQGDVNAEAAKIKSNVDYFQFYPVVAITALYRF